MSVNLADIYFLIILFIQKQFNMEKDYTREMLSKIRQLNEQTDKNKKLINEDKEENKSKAIAITDESIFGTNVKLEQLSNI